MLPPPPTLRQAGGRPLIQPVTNRNSTCGAQGVPSQANPDTRSRITKTVMVDCTGLRTVLMGFQMNPYERTLLTTAGQSGAYACTGATAATAGTGYTVGDVFNFYAGNSDIDGIILECVRVGASGAIAEVAVVNPGALKAPLADGTAANLILQRGGTTPSGGSGATFTFTWREYAFAANLGIEPTANQSGTGPAGIIKAGIGLTYTALGPQTTLLVPDGGFIVTDPIRLALTKGSPIAERLQTMGAPVGSQRTTMGVDFYANNSTPVANPGAFAGTLTSGTGVATVGTITLGRPNYPAPWFCIIGDSIDYGIVGGGGATADSGDGYQNSGWVERGLQLAGGYGLLSMTRPGDALGYWYLTYNQRFMRLGMFSGLADLVNFGACVFVLALAVNDITNGTSSANIIEMIQWLCQDLLAFNPAGLYYATCMPGAINSTDSFATVVNQAASVSSNNANRQAVNAWLRAGGGGLFTGAYGRTRTGIIDRAAAVEVSNNGVGVWKAGYTNDGTHPIQTVHATVLAPLVQTLAAGFALPG